MLRNISDDDYPVYQKHVPENKRLADDTFGNIYNYTICLQQQHTMKIKIIYQTLL